MQEGRAELVFFNIQMLALTGLHFLKICGQRGKVVLATAYPKSKYAPEGYERGAVNYLLKPIAFDRFCTPCRRRRHCCRLPRQQRARYSLPQPGALLVSLAADYLLMKDESKNSYLKINCANILHIEELKNYVAIRAPGWHMVTYQTVRALEAQLPPPFCECTNRYHLARPPAHGGGPRAASRHRKHPGRRNAPECFL